MIKRIRPLFLTLSLPFFTLGILFLVLFLYLPSQAASNATYVVNSTADTNDGFCNPAHCTLREAILAANDTPQADTIVFSLPANSTITLNGTQLPLITGTLTIDGSTAVNLTLSGNNASRLLVIGQPPPPYPRPVESPVEYTIGGSTAVTLTNLTFVDGNSEYGGGISNSGTLAVINSTFKSISSVYGGIYNNGALLITNTAFISNSITAGTSGGAAILNDGGRLHFWRDPGWKCGQLDTA